MRFLIYTSQAGCRFRQLRGTIAFNFRTVGRSHAGTRGPTGSGSDVEKKSRVEKKNHGTWTGSGYPSGRRGLGQRQNKKSEKRTKGKTGAAGTRPGFLGL